MERYLKESGEDKQIRKQRYLKEIFKRYKRKTFKRKREIFFLNKKEKQVRKKKGN